MGITYLWIKKYFSFLHNTYGFKICDRQTCGAYYYIVWTNKNISFKIIFDEREHDPISILMYDASSLGTIYDVIEYRHELICGSKERRTKIVFAAEWLQNSINNGNIVL